MGYTTRFEGVLKFKNEITAIHLRKLNTILGEDCRDHPEWKATNLYYINLEVNDDYTGLQWNGAEKTYDMPDLVNVVIDQMQKEFPDFQLEGQLLAQGEKVGDIWTLVIENGRAVRREIAINSPNLPPLNIANREALDLGGALGIPLERQNELSDALDEMSKAAQSGRARLIRTIDVIEYIHGLCATQEEFIYAFTNHTLWLARTGRSFPTQEIQDSYIKQFGNPTKL